MTHRAGPVSGPVRGSRARWLVRAAAIAAAALLSACQHEPQRLSSLGPAPERPPAATGGVSHEQVGLRLLAQNQPELALKSFNLAMIEDGVSHDALVGAAVANARLGRLRLARDMLERAVESWPDSVVARNNLGMTHYQLDDLPRARASLNAAFALSSGRDADVIRNLRILAVAEERAAANETVELESPDVYVVPQGGGVYRLERAEGSS